MLQKYPFFSPSWLKVGMGNGSFIVMVILVTIYAEALAFRTNGYQAEKMTTRIAAALGISAIIVILFNFILNAIGASKTFTEAVAFIGSFYTLLSLGIFIPLLVISRTPKLKVSSPLITVNV